MAVGEGQYRAVINTYFALAACAVVAFAVSAVVCKGKFDMVNLGHVLIREPSISSDITMLSNPFFCAYLKQRLMTISLL